MKRTWIVFIVSTVCLFNSSVLGVSTSAKQDSPTSRGDFSVEYFAFNGSSWTKYVEKDNGSDVECKVEITDAVGLVLTLTVVLPPQLKYTGEATPAPTNTSGNDLGGMNLYWTYDTGGGSQTVRFHVTIAGEGTVESLAAGLLLIPPLSDTDTINITGVGVNHPPLKPGTPTGEDNGKVGMSYTYTTSTTDPEGDEVYFLWDFGDGSQSLWLGPYASGEVASVDHIWDTRGSYQVKVKAKDALNSTSDWSEPLPVSMPKRCFSHRAFDFLVHHPFLMKVVGLRRH